MTSFNTDDNNSDSRRVTIIFLLIIATMGIVTLAMSVGVVDLPEEGLLNLIIDL